MAGRGLSYLRKQQEEYGAGGGDRIPKMWFKAGDIAKFWWGVFKDEDFYVPLMHIVPKQRRDGTTYSADAVCQRETRQDPREACEHCMNPAAKGPFDRLVAWAYVEQVVHPTKDAKGSEAWQQVKLPGGAYMFLEQADELRLFVMKSKLQEQVEARLAEYGTLTDRRYKLQIVGERQSRQELLIPDDKAEMPAAVKAAFASAMPLEDAMAQEFGGQRKAQTTGEGFGSGDLPSADGGPGRDEEVETLSF